MINVTTFNKTKLSKDKDKFELDNSLQRINSIHGKPKIFQINDKNIRS